jgi:hypothetical protein
VTQAPAFRAFQGHRREQTSWNRNVFQHEVPLLWREFQGKPEKGGILLRTP